MSKINVQTICKVAITTALLCICSWISIPTAVPFTMQTFAVFCSLLLLGGKKGTIVIGLYTLLGAIGLPVFSGFRGGIGHLFGPTGGFIIGFLIAALCYLLLEPVTLKNKKMHGPVLALGLLICYLIGTIWFCIVSGINGTSYSLTAILTACVWPYILPDLLKLILALKICERVQTIH